MIECSLCYSLTFPSDLSLEGWCWTCHDAILQVRAKNIQPDLSLELKRLHSQLVNARISLKASFPVGTNAP